GLFLEAVDLQGVLRAGGEVAVFVDFELVDGDVLTGGLAGGFVVRAGDVDGDRHFHFRMQGKRDGVHANGLDRIGQVDLVALDGEAVAGQSFHDVARGNRAIELAGF